MNTYLALAAAAAALAGSVDATACTTAQQQSAYLGMVGLLTGTSLSSCASDSGYNMLYATALPTDTQYVAMCAVDACHDLIVSVLATNPPDCDLTIPTSGAVMNVYELASTFETKCDSLTTTAPETTAPATSAPETTAPATDAPATTAPGTDAPATTAPGTDAPATTAPGTDAPATTEPVVPGGAC